MSAIPPRISNKSRSVQTGSTGDARSFVAKRPSIAYTQTMPSAWKILVTDDDPQVLELLSTALQADGYEVATAASGAETISRVNEFQPDLILLDMKFPPNSENFQSTLEDGFLIMSWLRGMSQAVKTPIIVISGTDPEEYRNRALAMGAVATLQKPVDMTRLLEIIRTTLENRRHAALKNRSPQAAVDNDPHAGSKSEGEELADLSAAQQRALFELLILAIYADGQVTTSEDKHLQKPLAAMGRTDKNERQLEFDAAVNRLRPFIHSHHQARDKALALAGAFTNRSQQKRVYATIEKMVVADQHVSSWESLLLMELRLKFRL